MYLTAEIGTLLATADPMRRPAAYFARQIRSMAQNKVIHTRGIVGQGRTAARDMITKPFYLPKSRRP